MTYDRLCEAVRLCGACPLGVRGVGVSGMYIGGESPTTMILGEAPGAVEQAKGQPFVGGSGQLLHSLLKEAGLTSYYVSNIAKHQPWVVKGKQQAPDKVTTEACSPFLKAEFNLVKPAKLILLGKTAAKLVCEGNFSMGKVVNQTYTYFPPHPVPTPKGAITVLSPVPTLILYHPAHFLYNRTAPWIQKQIADWKRAVRMFLGDRPPTYRIEKVRCEAHG